MENNFMLLRSGDRFSCIVELYTLNSLVTDDAEFCVETKTLFDDLIHKSIRISRESSERERIVFFKNIAKKVNLLQKKNRR